MSRELLKAILFVTKKTKADRHCMKFSLTTNTSVQRYLDLLFQNHRTIFLLPPIFWRISEPPGQDHQNGKLNVDYHPSPSEYPLKHTSSDIFTNSLRLYISPEYLLNCLTNLYIPLRLGEIFKFMVFRLLENAFASQ